MSRALCAPALIWWAWLVAVPGGAMAQEAGFGATVQRTVEAPAHRALLAVIDDPETQLAPFVSDGCSGGMSAAWRGLSDLFAQEEDAAGAGAPPWEDCCRAHDRLYHDAAGSAGSARAAGTDRTTGADRDAAVAASYAARLQADIALRACVIDYGETHVDGLSQSYEVSHAQIRMAYRAIGQTMFIAVRFGGAPCSGLPWRWGFGYPHCLPGME
ncbi:MAG: hypothetical protein AAGF79_06485 [Pseudomonadota bacterium]